jgi:hypothetical protein
LAQFSDKIGRCIEEMHGSNRPRARVGTLTVQSSATVGSHSDAIVTIIVNYQQPRSGFVPSQLPPLLRDDPGFSDKLLP